MDEKLINIIKVRTGIDFSKEEELKDVPLLGNKLNVPARELVLILLDVEKEYSIQLLKEEVIKGEFITFNRIINLIKRSIEYNPPR